MIEFVAHASSSAGNLYTVTDGRETLMIECGIGINHIRKSLGFSLASVSGVLVSHEHGDHAKAVRDVLKAGVDVYASRGTLEALDVSDHHRAHSLASLAQVQVGGWTILPFDVRHDAAEPLGFLIANQDGERLLYATDTRYIPYRFGRLDVIAVECNHSVAILHRRLARGAVEEAHYRRVIRNHMALERLLDMLKANDLSKVQEIHLLHLSDDNADEAAFKAEVQRATGKPVYVAGKG